MPFLAILMYLTRVPCLRALHSLWKRYWKEHCFGLTAETLVDKAMMLTHLGGTFGGNQQPTKFLCLVLKMLQIQPEKEIIIEFIKNEDYK